jgi:sec-independent protein translocase protein TatA
MMNEMILLIGGLGSTELIIIVLVIVLLFGASRLPQLAKSLGQSKRAFREGMDEADEEARLDARRRDRLRAADDEVRRDELAADKLTADKPR